MTFRVERPGTNATLGDHERRIRSAEKALHGPWVYPDLLNGWANLGGTKVPARYRWLAIGGIEIQASVSGGTLGTIAWTIADDFLWPDYDVRINGSDDDGNLVVWIVYQNGDVQVGL